MNPSQTVEQLTAFVKRAFQEAGFIRAVIALSGGVDSATSCALTVRAIGKENVFTVLLPYGSLDEQGAVDAKKVIEWLHMPQKNTTVVDIKSLVDPVISIDPAMDNVRRGNIMARMRMIVLFDEAKKRNALVVGTENKSEHLLGYYTRFGDEASDIEPLRNFYKTEVLQLARFLGVPEPIISKKPTAGLWEGQTDEGELGFSYKNADEILHQLYDNKKSTEDIIASGFDRMLVEKVETRMRSNAFKHRLPLVSE